MFYRRVQIKQQKFSDYVRDYCFKCTIVGVRHLAEIKRHPLEFLLWLTMLVLSMIGSGSIIWSTYTHYIANPIVVSLEKDFREWKFEIAAATICYGDKVDYNKRDAYISDHWGNITTMSESKREYYYKFIGAVMNMTYNTLEDFKQYKNDNTLSDIDLLDLAKQVYYDKNVPISLASRRDQFHQIMSANEMGFCLTFGSIVEQKLTQMKNSSARYDSYKPPTCTFILGQCFVKFVLKRAADFTIHAIDEMPDVTSRIYTVNDLQILELQLRNIQTIASQEVRALSIRRRQCVYQDDADYFGLPVYSYNFCRMECRRKLAIKLCGCAPPFYEHLNNAAKDPVCKVSGLACLANYTANHIVKLVDEKNKQFPCYCLPKCENLNFNVKDVLKQPWTLRYMNGTINKQSIASYAVRDYGHTRYKRDVIFTFDDLLVSLGSTAGLFMGCSILSIVEIIYFFTIRLFWYLWRQRRDKKSTEPRRRRLQHLVSLNTSTQ